MEASKTESEKKEPKKTIKPKTEEEWLELWARCYNAMPCDR